MLNEYMGLRDLTLNGYKGVVDLMLNEYMGIRDLTLNW